MREIKVYIKHYNGRCIEIDVRDDFVVVDVLDQLTEAGELSPEGAYCWWSVTFEKTGKWLDNSKTLAENGVKDGDILFIALCPGRPPIALSVVLQNGLKYKFTAIDDLIPLINVLYRYDSTLKIRVPSKYLIVTSEATGNVLDLTRSLDENGVKEGDTLHINWPDVDGEPSWVTELGGSLSLEEIDRHVERLETWYEEIVRVAELNEDLIEVVPDEGEVPPHVSKYLVTYKVPTWVKDGDEPRLQESTQVRIDLSDCDFTTAPRTHVVKGEVPFHAIWCCNGRLSNYCVWNHDSHLSNFLQFVLETLEFRASLIGVNDPANAAAAAWWLEHRDKTDKFPTDTRSLKAAIQGLELRNPCSHTEIVVTFEDQNGSNVRVAVPENMFIEDALQQLFEAVEITAPAPKQYWVVTFKETGDSVDISKTLAVNDVRDGDTLVIHVPDVIGEIIERSENIIMQEAKEINVNFVMQNGSNWAVAVPENVFIEDALQQLFEAVEITAPTPKQYWVVTFKETGDSVDISKTLAENDVKDGDTLVIHVPDVIGE